MRRSGSASKRVKPVGIKRQRPFPPRFASHRIPVWACRAPPAYGQRADVLGIAPQNATVAPWIWGSEDALRSSPRRARAWAGRSPNSSRPRARTSACARGRRRLYKPLQSTFARKEAASSRLSRMSRILDQTRLAVERTLTEFGRLDALVVNAGGSPRSSFAELNDEKFDAAYRLTFMSAVHLVQAALPALRQIGRSERSCSSPRRASNSRSAGLTLSNSIRGGVSGLAKTLSNELAPTIRVNSLLPGAIRTDRQIEMAQGCGGHRPGGVLCARR